tara:strand:- start:108 stop:320 length:213 start_codon:yes stop_codon:yes gene_type:complete
MLLVDSMAAKYGMLPTDVIRNATTQDVQIHFNVEAYRNDERQKASGNPVDLNAQYTQEELLEIWQKSRSQ